MDNYESRPLLSMPFPKPLKKMTDEELNNLLTGKFNYNVLIPGLIEAHLRKDEQIAELTKQITELHKRVLLSKRKHFKSPDALAESFGLMVQNWMMIISCILLIMVIMTTSVKWKKTLEQAKISSETVTTRQKIKNAKNGESKAMEIVRPTVQEWCVPMQYTSSPEIIKNCLQEVLSEGMMYSQVSAPADNEDMTKKQRENIIKKHMEQFTTKYYESDRRWHSFLPDATHPRGMKPIAKRKWEDLEAVIVAYYVEQEQANKRRKITLRTLYPEWFAYKWQDTNNSGYMNHIDGEWKRYYENDPIVDRPGVEFTTLELKNWARNKIITGKLNKKQYYNMAIIIRQSLEYLVELGELPCNHFAEFKIKASLFTPVIPKEAQQEVFTEEEEKKLKALAAAEFAEHPNRTAALAVLINFSLGLRVGELVALKWKDLKDSYLHIRRMEQKQYEQLENGKWKKHLEVVEHTKSDAGYRTLYVVSSAMELFDKVKEANLRNGYSCEAEDYIFMYRKHRITANSIDSHYERYCKQIGIAKKGNHKARKMALTKVADNPNINLQDAMEFAGHRDVKTFINHYCFSRYSDEQKRQELEKTLNV